MNRLRHRWLVICLSVGVVGACGRSDEAATLVGTWAIKDQGRLIEVVRLEQDGDVYLLSEKHQDRWVNRRPAAAVGRERLEAFLREPISAPFIALGHDRFVVVKTEPGWSAGRFRTETGYWLISPIGPLELHKR